MIFKVLPKSSSVRFSVLWTRAAPWQAGFDCGDQSWANLPGVWKVRLSSHSAGQDLHGPTSVLALFGGDQPLQCVVLVCLCSTVITEVACGINCTYSTALFNKYGLDCTVAEHTLGIAGFQGTQTETQKLTLLAAFSSQRNKQCKSKVLELILPLWNVCCYCLSPHSSPLYQKWKETQENCPNH